MTTSRTWILALALVLGQGQRSLGSIDRQSVAHHLQHHFALRNLALRTGVEELSTFATMLTQADKFGTSIGDSLRVFSDDLRHKRQMRAEENAAKVPTKMLFPLVLCIFPSIIMVILGPAVIQIIRTVLPMLSGHR